MISWKIIYFLLLAVESSLDVSPHNHDSRARTKPTRNAAYDPLSLATETDDDVCPVTIIKPLFYSCFDPIRLAL